ncbi:M48 family metallopeptidase [Actinophytocola sp.]|uniref:M48 family metallopeptidase n=1 Tax=Actinophytocola sp. TaxID=1872138 RepID=UPI003D6A066B
MRMFRSSLAAAILLIIVPLSGLAISAALIGFGVFLGLVTDAPTSSFVLRRVDWGRQAIIIFSILLGLFMLVSTIRGMIRALRDRPMTDGVRLPRDRAPQLWSFVDDVARRVGVPPPDEIRLLPESTARVNERSRWLGLRTGRRTLGIGHPWLVALTVQQLAAVLAHELGHFTNGDTRWGAFALRGSKTIGHVVEEFQRGSVHYRLYRRMLAWYLRLSLAEQRRQELSADRISATVVGRAGVADTLCLVPAIDQAWSSYAERVSDLASEIVAVPSDVAGGFASYLAEPEIQQLIARFRDVRNHADHTDPFDSHPSTVERVAALRDAPDVAERPDRRPALALLGNLAVPQVYAPLVGVPGPDRPLLDWPTLFARALGERDLHETRHLLASAEQVTRQRGANGHSVLWLLEHGYAANLAGALLGADGPVEVSAGSPGGPVVASAVRALVRAAAVSTGRYRYQVGWLRPVVVDENGMPLLPTTPTPDDPFGVAALQSSRLDFVPPPMPATRPPKPASLLPWMFLRASAVDLLGYPESLVIVRRPSGRGLRTNTATPDVLNEYQAGIAARTPAEHAADGARVIPLADVVHVRLSGEARKMTFLMLRGESKVKLARHAGGRGPARAEVTGFFTGLLGADRVTA